MPITLFTLNIEGDKHLDLWLSVVQEMNVDVLCLQELYQADCEMIGQALGMKWQFAPTVKMEQPNNYRMSLRGNWGIGIFSKLPLENVVVHSYSEDSQIRVFQEPNDPRRMVIVAEVLSGQERYRIATTHFTWSPGGEIIQLQRDDFQRLRTVLSQYSDLVLCGDFNAPRGKELFGLFEELYHDNLPKEVMTTIDQTLHYSGKPLQLVVDTIFTTPHYKVSQIKVIEKVSDHKGIWARIELAD